MNEFISKFKQTSYYQNLFDIEDEILLIYIGGSRCYGTMHELSDYDITIITLNGEFKNMHKYLYLMYNGKKVHWYYLPIKHFFYGKCTDIWDYTGILTLKGISDDLILYKNLKYEKILEKLLELKNEIIHPVCYNILEFKKDYVENLLRNGCISTEYFAKDLYFLCLASYCLLDEPIDKDFLKAINLSRHHFPVSNEYRQKVIERLKLYRNSIEQNPIDVDNVLNLLYRQLEIEVLNKQEDI